MKAKELMIGDWVMPLKKKLKGIPGKVITIDGGTNVCWIDSKDYSCLVPCSDVERIPLTPEILEKNGFRLMQDVYVLASEKWQIYIIQDVGKWSIDIRNEIAAKDDLGRADLVTFLRDWTLNFYVHELQQALRLCGIDKEIIVC